MADKMEGEPGKIFAQTAQTAQRAHDRFNCRRQNRSGKAEG
jgi:hypothetical protein